MTTRIRPTRTGRANLIRAWLQQHERGFTVSELRAALDPAATAAQFSGSLATLALQGDIHRATKGKFSCYACTQALADRQLRTFLADRAAREQARTAPRPPKPPAPPTPARATKASNAMPQRVTRGPTVTERDIPRGIAPAPAPAKPRRTEAACALHGIPDANRAASTRIAADIAAFQAKGGRVERLGVTNVFKHIGTAANDENTRARARGAASARKSRA